MRQLLSTGLLTATITSLAACGNVSEVDPNAAAAQCGQYECPVGTAPKELRQVKGGYDISGGLDLTAYSAEGAYSVFGEGNCEYACELLDPCDEGTFPVITKDCFTCGVLNASGQAVQGNCGGQPVEVPVVDDSAPEPDATSAEDTTSADTGPADHAGGG